jgi:hypothetical protein
MPQQEIRIVVKIDDLVGKDVEIVVPMTKRLFYYHGKLLSVDGDDVWINDIKVGKVMFKRSDIKSWRELNHLDYIRLMSKFDSIAMRVKFQQADDKVKKKFEKFSDKLREAFGVKATKEVE